MPKIRERVCIPWHILRDPRCAPYLKTRGKDYSMMGCKTRSLISSVKSYLQNTRDLFVRRFYYPAACIRLCRFAFVFYPIVAVFVSVGDGMFPVKRAAEMLHNRFVRFAKIRHQFAVTVLFCKIGNRTTDEMNADPFRAMQRIYFHAPRIVP